MAAVVYVTERSNAAAMVGVIQTTCRVMGAPHVFMEGRAGGVGDHIEAMRRSNELTLSSLVFLDEAGEHLWRHTSFAREQAYLITDDAVFLNSIACKWRWTGGCTLLKTLCTGRIACSGACAVLAGRLLHKLQCCVGVPFLSETSAIRRAAFFANFFDGHTVIVPVTHDPIRHYRLFQNLFNGCESEDGNRVRPLQCVPNTMDHIRTEAIKRRLNHVDILPLMMPLRSRDSPPKTHEFFVCADEFIEDGANMLVAAAKAVPQAKFVVGQFVPGTRATETLMKVINLPNVVAAERKPDDGEYMCALRAAQASHYIFQPLNHTKTKFGQVWNYSIPTAIGLAIPGVVTSADMKEFNLQSGFIHHATHDGSSVEAAVRAVKEAVDILDESKHPGAYKKLADGIAGQRSVTLEFNQMSFRRLLSRQWWTDAHTEELSLSLGLPAAPLPDEA